MLNLPNDQAAGLRRIMAGTKTRVISVLSASAPENQPRMLTNLAATLSASARNVLILHAAENAIEATRSYGITALPSLVDVVNKKAALTQTVRQSAQQFYTARMLPKNHSLEFLDDRLEQALNVVFNKLAAHFDVVLVDTQTNQRQALPLAALNESEIMIRLTRDPESIKQAYLMMKQICAQLGRRNFGIVVDASSDTQAATVFRNISQAARRFMLIDLEFYGAIPADEHLNRAAKLGRAVTEAFPKAKASLAFQTFAQRVDYQQYRSVETELASLI